MNKLGEIPTVLFMDSNEKPTNEPPLKARFILATCSVGGDEKIVFRSGFGRMHHETIYDMLCDKAAQAGFDVESQGGGFLSTDVEAKKITVGGTSLDLGSADAEKARELLMKALPEYEIRINPNHRPF